MAYLSQICAIGIQIRRAELARLFSVAWLGLIAIALVAAFPDAVDPGDDGTADSDVACEYQAHAPSAGGPSDVLAVPEISGALPAPALLGSLPSPIRLAAPLAPPLPAARCRGDPTLGLS